MAEQWRNVHCRIQFTLMQSATSLRLCHVCKQLLEPPWTLQTFVLTSLKTLVRLGVQTCDTPEFKPSMFFLFWIVYQHSIVGIHIYIYIYMHTPNTTRNARALPRSPTPVKLDIH